MFTETVIHNDKGTVKTYHLSISNITVMKQDYLFRLTDEEVITDGRKVFAYALKDSINGPARIG